MSRETVNKSDLVKIISEKCSVSQNQVNNVLTEFCNCCSDSLKSGKSVILVGFGTFTTGERKARVGRNPQNGDVINIPAATVPKFRPGKILKDAVAGEKKKKK